MKEIFQNTTYRKQPQRSSAAAPTVLLPFLPPAKGKANCCLPVDAYSYYSPHPQRFRCWLEQPEKTPYTYLITHRYSPNSNRRNNHPGEKHGEHRIQGYDCH
jgi:hypothetical protein